MVNPQSSFWKGYVQHKTGQLRRNLPNAPWEHAPNRRIWKKHTRQTMTGTHTTRSLPSFVTLFMLFNPSGLFLDVVLVIHSCAFLKPKRKKHEKVTICLRAKPVPRASYSWHVSVTEVSRSEEAWCPGSRGGLTSSGTRFCQSPNSPKALKGSVLEGSYSSYSSYSSYPPKYHFPLWFVVGGSMLAS